MSFGDVCRTFSASSKEGFWVFRVFNTAQRQLTFEDAQVQCGGLMDKESFYSLLEEHGHYWIVDEDYASIYDPNLGYGCVPPSRLGLGLCPPALPALCP